MVQLKKTATYSILHITVAFIVAYLITGSFIASTAISLLEPMVQSVVYFFHETVWAKILAKKPITSGA
ncbi:MAG TPA: hypothetical protein DIV86_03180 [Alphaproteobacteria bacterium]|nr:hypothetical protein [Alphaproteobacteria bacterium]